MRRDRMGIGPRVIPRMKVAMTKRGGWLFALLLGGAILAAAQAQPSYPDRPIRIVIGFGPGGLADITMRLVGQKLTELTGQQVVIENRPSAGGIVAASAVTSARPDGYTLFVVAHPLQHVTPPSPPWPPHPCRAAPGLPVHPLRAPRRPAPPRPPRPTHDRLPAAHPPPHGLQNVVSKNRNQVRLRTSTLRV